MNLLRRISQLFVADTTFCKSFERTNSSLDMQRRTGQEERPSALLLADLAKSLEIPHLTDGSSPFSEKPFMQAPACLSQQGVAKTVSFYYLLTSLHWWRPCFESDSISSYCGEVIVV